MGALTGSAHSRCREIPNMDILDLIDQGVRRVAANDDAARLRRSAEHFMRAYGEYAGYSVVAASPHAERVLGAAMMLQPDLQAGGAGDTVILDVNVASGTLIARAARRLRDAGNRGQLVAVALHSLVDDMDQLTIADVARLVVADEVRGQSLDKEHAQSRDHCVVFAG
jgi:hypothetical protein